MTWKIRLAGRAEQALKRTAERDQERIVVALKDMTRKPFSGDVRRLKAQPFAFRRRVGPWRIFFDVDHENHVVEVVNIRRRTSTTYQKNSEKGVSAL